MTVIDFHTHILPQMDDGSRSLEESIEMIDRQQKNGVDIVVATPHFYAERETIQAFLERRERAVRQLSSVDIRGIRLIQGCEVCYFTGVSKVKDLDCLCINGTDLLLLEMPFAQWDESVYQEVRYLITHQKKRVILAHIERYLPYQKDRSVWEAIFEMPVIGQCNAEQLLQWSKKRTIIKLFDTGYAQILGSDCHGIRNRVPNLWEGREVLKKKLGQEVLDEMDRFGAEILKGAIIFGGKA